jgi:rhodanese-related sulfurtransferase
MRRILVAIVALLALAAVASCSSSGTTTTLAPGPFQELTQEPGVVTLDVRTPEEYAAGHLPNAVNLDVESPTFAAGLAQLDPDATYAVYCRSANRSKVAMDQMSQAGIEDVQDLDGGIVAWQAEGLPVVQ